VTLVRCQWWYSCPLYGTKSNFRIVTPRFVTATLLMVVSMQNRSILSQRHAEETDWKSVQGSLTNQCK